MSGEVLLPGAMYVTSHTVIIIVSAVGDTVTYLMDLPTQGRCHEITVAPREWFKTWTRLSTVKKVA